MELHQLRYVLAVAELRNFTRAAERCRVVQSALSHQIARLERELGTRLFERTSRKVRLTPAGEAFLPAARQCLDAAERAVAEVAAAIGEIRGRLAVGLIPTVTAVDLPAALHRFRQRHPQVRISLKVGASDDLIGEVKDGELDLAFLGLPTTVRPEGVGSRKLGTDRLVAVVSPEHPLATKNTVNLKRLSHEVFADLPAGTAGREQSDRAFSSAKLSRDVAFEVTTPEFIVRLVEQNLAVAMLPSAYVPRLTGLVTIDVADAAARTEHVIWGKHRTPAAAAFLAELDAPDPPERT